MADSRFNLDKFIVDTDKSFIAANIKGLRDLKMSVYTIPPKYVKRLDLISYELYETVNLKWVLLYVNDIVDMSVLEFGYKLKYPTQQDLLKLLFETAENV